MAFLKELAVAGGVDDGSPLLRRADGLIEQQAEVDIDTARDILRPFDIAVHPVNRVRYPA
jgi:hypothetical protein